MMADFLLIIAFILLLGSGIRFFKLRGKSLAEAGAFSCISLFFAGSVGGRILSIIGPHKGRILVPILLFILSLAFAVKTRAKAYTFWIRPAFKEPIAGLIFITALFVLIKCVLAPDQEIFDPALSSGNIEALSFLNAETGLQTIAFAYLGFLLIGFSTYALSRRYAWQPTSLTATYIAMSMPGILRLTTAGSAEVISAGTALFCVMAIWRLIEQADGSDALFLLLAILFSISCHPATISFFAIIVGFAVISMGRRHGGYIWRRIFVNTDRLHLIVSILLAAIFLAGIKTGSFSHAKIYYNKGGIAKAAGNLYRYFIDMIRGCLPFRNSRGMQGHPGFGPFAIFLVLPSVLYALKSGPRRLKILAVSLLLYIYLVSLIFEWQPENMLFFTPFFTCAAFFTAYFLPPWRFSKKSRSVIVIICFLQALTAIAL